MNVLANHPVIKLFKGLMHTNMVEGSKGSLVIYKKRYLYIFVEKGKIFEKRFFI